MSALADFEDSDTLRIEALAFDLDGPDQIAGHRTRPKLCVEKVSRIALATALLALGWCFSGASLASSAHEARARATAGTNRTFTPRLATVLATGEPVMTIGANEFAVASSSPYPAPLGTHLHSSDDGVYGNPSDEAEVGSLFEEEEVRGLAEFVLDGQPQASTATLTFRVGILGGLFEQPFGVFDIAVATYDGNNGKDIEDFEAPATAAVGTFATGGLEVGQLITFDVTGPFNAALSAGVAELGVRLQPTSDPVDAAVTFEDFQLTIATTTTTTIATTTTAPPTTANVCGNGVLEGPEQCDLGAQNGTPGSCCTASCTFRAAADPCRAAVGACDAPESCTGTSADCPADQLRPAGDVCRPEASPCDRAETCGGTDVSCPPDSQREPGEECNDDDPETGTSSCTDTLVCQGVSTGVAVQPEIVVRSFESPKQVKIPVSVEVGDTPGRKKAAVVLQGLVSCFEIPRELAPSRCANDDTADVNRGHTAGLRSVFLRVTPKINRSLGRTQSRTMTVRLPLTKMGQKLFAKLGITPEGFPLQIQSTIGDRQGRKIRTNFPTVLRREP